MPSTDKFGNEVKQTYDDHNISLYLKSAYQAASKSPDPSSQCGAVIVDSDGYIISRGTNKFHHTLKWTKEQLLDREWKLFHIEHAERNSIYNLAKAGISTVGLTMVCPWFACADCARAILHTGISKVIGHKERMDMTPERWRASVDAGLNFLIEGGVELEFWSGKVGCEPIIVNGELWHP